MSMHISYSKRMQVVLSDTRIAIGPPVC